MFLPRLPHTDVKLLLFAPDAARSVKENKHNKQTKDEETKEQGKKEVHVPSAGLSYVKLCDTAASVH